MTGRISGSVTWQKRRERVGAVHAGGLVGLARQRATGPASSSTIMNDTWCQMSTMHDGPEGDRARRRAS